MTTAHIENDRRPHPDSSPGWRHFVVFLGKTLLNRLSHCLSLHPGVQTGYLQDDDGILVSATLYAVGNPAMD